MPVFQPPFTSTTLLYPNLARHLTGRVITRNMRRPGSGLSVKRNAKKNIKKPGICTADELHYVAVSNSEWKLALWRYCLPSPKSSVARFMSDQGFDAWTLEL
ncbi:hypothetical protein OIU84_008022 [Salix udensis]|uniref:Uncharacterized protein n=1 Tax=Salix udensis TaxID=889485 RepID=A0AAD6P034_9ROSI|nr:hypothetical protein OIU84_008022 [Salix udensis]